MCLNVHGCAPPFIGHLLDTKPRSQPKLLILLALPRGLPWPNNLNDLTAWFASSVSRPFARGVANLQVDNDRVMCLGPAD
jgi:hypothetical protein